MAPEDLEVVRMLFEVAKHAVQFMRALIPFIQDRRRGVRRARHRKNRGGH